jgi:hypothetical protein
MPAAVEALHDIKNAGIQLRAYLLHGDKPGVVGGEEEWDTGMLGVSIGNVTEVCGFTSLELLLADLQLDRGHVTVPP